MGRFLLFISYIGTHYSGLQAQSVAGRQRTDVKTICGVLEKCLTLLRPQNEVKIVTSSRTDAGVHALRNAVHVDLEHRNPEKEFQERNLVAGLNGMLTHKKEFIRVLEACRVNDDFHSRYKAQSRSYMYHLALCHSEMNDGYPVMPLDLQRTYYRFHPLDLNKLLETAEMLSGTHYFNAFTTPSSLVGRTTHPVRTVEISVKRGAAFLEDYRPEINKNMEFWEIHVKSPAFLFRMVRRMVGAMVSVSQGKQSLEHIKAALSDPTYIIPSPGIMTVPGYALYLKDVQYDPQDLQYSPPNSCGALGTASCKGILHGHQSDTELMGRGFSADHKDIH